MFRFLMQAAVLATLSLSFAFANPTTKPDCRHGMGFLCAQTTPSVANQAPATPTFAAPGTRPRCRLSLGVTCVVRPDSTFVGDLREANSRTLELPFYPNCTGPRCYYRPNQN